MEFADFATLTGILIALLTWLVTHLKEQNTLKLNNTVTLISNLSTVQHLQDADLAVRSQFGKEKPSDSIPDDANLQNSLPALLDYYEFLAELFWNKTVDQLAIMHLRGGLMKQTYQFSLPYIQAERKKQARDDLWTKFEKLALELGGREQ